MYQDTFFALQLACRVHNCGSPTEAYYSVAGLLAVHGFSYDAY